MDSRTKCTVLFLVLLIAIIIVNTVAVTVIANSI